MNTEEFLLFNYTAKEKAIEKLEQEQKEVESKKETKKILEDLRIEILK